MPKVCFVPGCETGYQTQQEFKKWKGVKKPSLFKPLKDPVVFQQWQRVLPRADRLLTHADRVCSRHFKKEDITYYNEPVKLFDGSVYLHMLERPRLKKGAVPSIFTDTPDHSINVSEIKSSENKKCNEQKDQCDTTTKQLKNQKATYLKYGAEIAEIENERFSSNGKENVLKTDLSLLPSIFLNCLTSEPHTVLSTLNKSNTNECKSPHSQSIANNNFSSETPSNEQCPTSEQRPSENTAAKENASLKQSELHSDMVSNVPDKVSSFIKFLTSNMEIISTQPYKECDVSVKPQTIFKSSEVTKDISASSQEIVQLSPDSQSSMPNSEVAPNQSETSNSSLDFRENFVHANLPNELTTKSYMTLHPLEPQKIISIDPDVIFKSPNKLSSLTKESKNLLHPKSIRTATEMIQQLPDTNVTESLCPQETESDVDMPSPAAKHQFWFNFLKDNAHNIDNINSWWTVNTFDDFVIYARWSPDYLVDRKIIIYEDLKIKVFLKEKEAIFGNNLVATSMESISKLIHKVERLQLCKNVLDKERSCNGYLDESFICKHRNLCVNCIKWEEERLKEEQQLKRLMQEERDEIELSRFKVGI